MGGGKSQYPRVVDRIKRRISSMLLIILTLPFLYAILQFMYYIFIHIFVSHCFNYFVCITCRLLKSWHQSAALLLMLLPLLPAPGEPLNLSMTRIWMMILAWYPAMTIFIKVTIWNSMTSLVGDHPGKQWASRHRKSTSFQLLENEVRQLNQLLHRHNRYVLSVGRSIFPRCRSINAILHWWHRRSHMIKHLHSQICRLMVILTIGRIQTKSVHNWLHGMLEICG